jgi:hypothetical protein
MASAASTSTAGVIGVATHEILDTAQGSILVKGSFQDIDTSSFILGGDVFLSDTLGAISPTVGTIDTALARVLTVGTTGTIFVFPTIGGTGSGGPGATGLQGATGLASGPQGVTGLEGIQGVTGLKCPGATGIQGLTGSFGETGIGIPGETGIGIPGETGIIGLPGETGIIGLPGETGMAGATGLSGAGGLAGVTQIATLLIGGAHFPIADNAFFLAGPDACATDHWHSGTVCSLEGTSAVDPAPGVCGHGGKVPTAVGLVSDLGTPDAAGLPEVLVIVDMTQYAGWLAAPCPGKPTIM